MFNQMTVIYNNNLGRTIIKMINRGLWWGGGGSGNEDQ